MTATSINRHRSQHQRPGGVFVGIAVISSNHRSINSSSVWCSETVTTLHARHQSRAVGRD
jgi:hypothetical protein